MDLTVEIRLTFTFNGMTSSERGGVSNAAKKVTIRPTACKLMTTRPERKNASNAGVTISLENVKNPMSARCVARKARCSRIAAEQRLF